MDRRTFIASVGLSASALGAGCLDGADPGRDPEATPTPRNATSGRGTETATTYRNPVFEEVFADPSAVRTPDGAFYAYATYHPWGDGDARPHSRLIPIARSRDLVNWAYAGAAFESRPDWRDAAGLWAPDINRHRGRYVLYYSYAEFGDPDPGIGVGVSDSPEGPFEDRGRLLQSSTVGVPNSIDPCMVRTDDGPYLFWGSKRGIHGAPLADDGLSLAGETFRIAGDGVEAASLVERDGRHYFFGSRGTCCAGADSTYHVVVGRSDALDGPYVNRDGQSLLDAPGTTVLHGDDTFAGPGHGTVVRGVAGDDWLLYHAYERSNPWKGKAPGRVLMLDRIVWRDGWPTVETRTPSGVAPAPAVDSHGDADDGTD